MSEHQLIFVANRIDGLGERLKALINAITLAKYYEATFSLVWKPFSRLLAKGHAVGDVEDIFSADFIAHYVRPAPRKTISLKEFLKSEKSYLQSHEGPLGVIVPNNNIFHNFPSLRSVISISDRSSAFENIKFSQRLLIAIEAGKAVTLDPNAIAIHLRSGDIIYGRYRFESRYTNKVTPFPFAFHLAKYFLDQGRQVVVFGQDDRICQNICSLTGAICAGGLHSQNKFDRYQSAAFDIVLMSRCESIVAGNSGFAEVASVIGGANIKSNIRDFFNDSVASDILIKTGLHDDLSVELQPSDLQRAFCCWYAVHNYSAIIPDEIVLELLNNAMKYDPKNPFYGICAAVFLGKNNFIGEADTCLARYCDSSFVPEKFGSIIDIIIRRFPDGKYALDDLEPGLEALAKKGSRNASTIAALLAFVKGRSTEFKGFSEMANVDNFNALYETLLKKHNPPLPTVVVKTHAG